MERDVTERPDETAPLPPAEEVASIAGRDVYWFVGGPLDGRVHSRPASEPVPTTVRYVHLHEGPQIVHYYDLHEVAGHGGEYRLRADTV